MSGEEKRAHDRGQKLVQGNSAIVDTAWVEPEAYATHRYLLNLPGETSGSYSRNLNHLWARGVP